ncbi:TetR/AcrR family transcriptional regulator [Nocardioides daejeonensis]|uniref:TetR/AcrR family transcriptional regulator n=1 Tax=Nocardioides daejeonensis TaxID=1046556 RepID=UPI001951D0D0|nr:TetR/AcrR family transcriptional regulator [Nocardioides daejeonensis]
MRTPAQSRSSASADRMLEATQTLLREGGLGAVTIAAVASRAGTSNGSLYHRFGDRTGLLLATQERSFAEITTETAEAFARADAALAAGHERGEAARLLAAAALEIFTRHHGTLRAFMVETQGQPEFEEQSEPHLHAIAALVTSWLSRNLGASPAAAEAAWRILFSIGAAQALVEERRISPATLDRDEFAEAVARAILAVTTTSPASH